MLTNVDLTRIDTIAQFPVGDVYEGSLGRKYRYVEYNDGDGNVAGVAGYLAYLCTGTGVGKWTVTCDYDSATIATARNQGVGFLMAALTNGKFGWMQISGPNDMPMLTETNVAAGHTLVAHAANGTVIGIAAGSNHTGFPLAIAVAADTDAALAAGNAYITIGG